MVPLFRMVTFSLVLVIGASSSSLFAAPCVPGPTRLCLNEQRFGIEVQWKNFEGGTGVGQAIPLTSDTGYFWFFSSSNVELVVKVLDGRGLNGRFWVFFGALSNVEYTMTVTDSVSGSTKTYFNPSGQFASVGDTSAFSASGMVHSAFHWVESTNHPVAPLMGTLPAEKGKLETQAVPTCVGTETSLCLNGGRFRVDVNWKTPQGATGTGKAIPLTSDTGYFWFFNSANVELVVKVLDARALNQKFWVFYGALSNVEYEMTVTDTLTGNIVTYVNPSGQFASAGDTAAFPAGYSVAVRLDESRAVSAEIPVTGGTISATASDGSVFTLTIPNDALLSDATITMTPVAGIDGLPLSGGLAAAVDLQPTGLLLLDFATLTIAPATGVPLSEEITFAWRGNGEEFFLFPLELGTSDIVMKVMHFSGYGVGRGTAADQAAQQQRIPASPEDALDQRLQELMANERRTQSNGVGTLGNHTARHHAELVREYDTRIRPIIEDMKRSCDRAKKSAPGVFRFLVRLRVAGCCPAKHNEGRSALIDIFVKCYNDSFDWCVQANQPQEVSSMFQYYGLLRRLVAGGLVDQTKIERCARFELTFKSEIDTAPPGLFSWRVRAFLPIQIEIPSGVGKGSARLEMFDVKYTGAPIPPICTNTITTHDGYFYVRKLAMDLNYYEGGLPPNPLEMVYDPGEAGHNWTLQCPHTPPSITEWLFRDIYAYGIRQEGGFDGFQFTAKKWTLVGGNLWARKTYNPPAPPYPQRTVMELKHTPDK